MWGSRKQTELKHVEVASSWLDFPLRFGEKLRGGLTVVNRQRGDAEPAGGACSIIHFHVEQIPVPSFNHFCNSFLHLSPPFYHPPPPMVKSWQTDEFRERSLFSKTVGRKGRQPTSLELVWGSNGCPSLANANVFILRCGNPPLRFEDHSDHSFSLCDGSLLGHLLLNVLQEFIVGRGWLRMIFHQVLEERTFSRGIVPAWRENTKQTKC